MALFEAPQWVAGNAGLIKEIIAQYPEKRSAIMPLLHLAQDTRGYVADEDIEAVAELTDQTPAYVNSVCSFYAGYHRHPMGKHKILVCNNLACALGGARAVCSALQQELGIADHHGTTPDGLISLEITHECLANCDGGPCLQIDGRFVVKATPEKARAIVADLKAGNSCEHHLEKVYQTGLKTPGDTLGIPAYVAPAPAAKEEGK